MPDQIFTSLWSKRIQFNATDTPSAEVIGFCQLGQTKIYHAEVDIQLLRKV